MLDKYLKSWTVTYTNMGSLYNLLAEHVGQVSAEVEFRNLESSLFMCVSIGEVQ